MRDAFRAFRLRGLATGRQVPPVGKVDGVPANDDLTARTGEVQDALRHVL